MKSKKFEIQERNPNAAANPRFQHPTSAPTPRFHPQRSCNPNHPLSSPSTNSAQELLPLLQKFLHLLSLGTHPTPSLFFSHQPPLTSSQGVHSSMSGTIATAIVFVHKSLSVLKFKLAFGIEFDFFFGAFVSEGVGAMMIASFCFSEV